MSWLKSLLLLGCYSTSSGVKCPQLFLVSCLLLCPDAIFIAILYLCLFCCDKSDNLATKAQSNQISCNHLDLFKPSSDAGSNVEQLYKLPIISCSGSFFQLLTMSIITPCTVGIVTVRSLSSHVITLLASDPKHMQFLHLLNLVVCFYIG